VHRAAHLPPRPFSPSGEYDQRSSEVRTSGGGARTRHRCPRLPRALYLGRRRSCCRALQRRHLRGCGLRGAAAAAAPPRPPSRRRAPPSWPAAATPPPAATSWLPRWGPSRVRLRPAPMHPGCWLICACSNNTAALPAGFSADSLWAKIERGDAAAPARCGPGLCPGSIVLHACHTALRPLSGPHTDAPLAPPHAGAPQRRPSGAPRRRPPPLQTAPAPPPAPPATLPALG
jgi:hypothetical protein